MNLIINKNYLLEKYASGVRLSDCKTDKPNSRRINNIVNFPFPVYFQDEDHKTILCNEVCVEELGFDSIKECIGKEWHRPFYSQSVRGSMMIDKQVTENQEYIIAESFNIRKDNSLVPTLSFRMPLYQNNGKQIGLFGCSIVINKHSLSEAITLLQSHGFLNSFRHNRWELTPREMDCLNYTVKGMSAKKIGEMLGLSHRTIEEYLNNIKKKVGVNTKAELIEKMSDAD